MATQVVLTDVVSKVFASGSTTLTFTAGTDFTATASGKGFARIIDAQQVGTGPTSGGGLIDDDFHTAYLSSGDPSGNIVATRQATGIDHRVTIEIWEYVGAAAGANEVIVRDIGVIENVRSSTSYTGTTVTTISDINDAVVLVTGVSSDDTHVNDCWLRRFIPSLVANGSDWDPTFTRGKTTGINDIWLSYVVLEFTGSNWGVDRWESATEGTVWTTSTQTSYNVSLGFTIPVAITKAFTIPYAHTSNDPCGDNDANNAYRLASTTQMECYNRSIDGVVTMMAWVIWNTQADGTARNLTTQHLYWYDSGTTGSEEHDYTWAGDSITAIDAVDESSVFSTCSVDGLSAIGRGRTDWRMTSTTVMSGTEHDANDQQIHCVCLVEWPEDPAAAGGTVNPFSMGAVNLLQGKIG